jgi:hypothetical protein
MSVRYREPVVRGLMARADRGGGVGYGEVWRALASDRPLDPDELRETVEQLARRGISVLFPRCFLQCWNGRVWGAMERREGQPLSRTCARGLLQHGLRLGDEVYVVGARSGRLHLCGRMEVGLLRGDVCLAARATEMRFSRSVPDAMARRLRFVSGRGELPPRIDVGGIIRLRGVHELTEEASLLLDALLHHDDEFAIDLGT